MVLSLDAEKALDRIEWDFLFFTLKELDLGKEFIEWVKLLYHNPLGAVITTGKCSPYFILGRGTRQGCPLSPLLFAIAIEPLAEAIRTHSTIHSISINHRHHKISLYADDVLLFITQPEISTMSVLSVINEFSKFSDHKINFSKSEAMPLGQVHHSLPPGLSPFRWATEGFVYLGIFITPLLQRMFKANFQPLLKRIHNDLQRWSSSPLSMLGRISLIKMIILPRLLYKFQMIPVPLNNNTIKTVNGWFRSFIWNCKRPRLKLAKLQLPLGQGGLAIPNIRLRQVASQFRYIVDWVRNDPDYN